MTKNPENIMTFKLLGLLLSYPENVWINELPSLISVIKSENRLSATLYKDLDQFLSYCKSHDLIDIQQNYVFLFDQNRALSLHLFEHIHGESRDRGQAMVDLGQMYKSHGVEIDKNELPDYLPLFLEFLSILPSRESLDLLKETMPIIKNIAKNLAAAGSEYILIFNCLLYLGGESTFAFSASQKEIDVRVLSEELDREWEEQEVKFLGNNNINVSCSSASQGNTVYIDANSIPKCNSKSTGEIL